MTTSDPAPESTDAWGAILALPIGDRRAWPMMRTALLIADRAIALMPGTQADTDRERLREAIATETYRQLRDYDAITYPQTPPDQQAPICVADPDEIRQWLTGPVHDQDQHNLAHYLDLDNAWHASATDIAVRLAPLLREAQYDGVFGVPDHEILVVEAVRPEADGQEFYINIQPPMGPQLMIGYLTPADLLGGQTRGVDVAIHTLTTIARDVNGALQDQAALLGSTARDAVLWASQQDRPPQVPRAFAAPLAGASAEPPGIAPSTDPSPDPTRPRSR